MRKMIKQILILVCLVVLLVLPYFVFAQGNLGNAFDGEGSPLDKARVGAGYADADSDSVARIAGTVVSILLSLLGIILVVLIIYGGYLWMTARGDEQQVTKAKDTIQKAIIGLVVVLSAFGIYMFIWYGLIDKGVLDG